MQTPTGFHVGENNILYPDNWMDIIFNPSFLPRFFHMITASYLTTAFVIAGVAAWYMLKGRYIKMAQIMFANTMIAIAILAPLQIVLGDIHGTNTLAYQPEKVAAIEGLWDTKQYADLLLFAVPDEDMQTNHHEIRIPGMASLILTHSWDGEVQGLKEFMPNIAPVAPVFFSFRIMVGIGLLMLLTSVLAFCLYHRKRLFTSTLFQRWCILMAPSGFIAVIAGWCVTEIGRQPYVVFGVLKTADMASPVPAEVVAWSLLLFVVVYFAVFGAGIYYILRLVRKGPTLGQWHDDLYGGHHIKEPTTLADVFKLTH
jgi:cytochrome d ubiquinol oxidase subunit I